MIDAQPTPRQADTAPMLAPMLLLLALTNDPRLLDELAELLREWAAAAEA